jgi:hypothetical protein
LPPATIVPNGDDLTRVRDPGSSRRRHRRFPASVVTSRIDGKALKSSGISVQCRQQEQHAEGDVERERVDQRITAAAGSSAR